MPCLFSIESRWAALGEEEVRSPGRLCACLFAHLCSWPVPYAGLTTLVGDHHLEETDRRVHVFVTTLRTLITNFRCALEH